PIRFRVVGDRRRQPVDRAWPARLRLKPARPRDDFGPPRPVDDGMPAGGLRDFPGEPRSRADANVNGQRPRPDEKAQLNGRCPRPANRGGGDRETDGAWRQFRLTGPRGGLTLSPGAAAPEFG